MKLSVLLPAVLVLLLCHYCMQSTLVEAIQDSRGNYQKIMGKTFSMDAIGKISVVPEKQLQRNAAFSDWIGAATDNLEEEGSYDKINPAYHNEFKFNATKYLGELRSKPTMRDFPCPIASEIAPCLCYYDQDFNVDLNCSAVVSEDQLEAVFQKEFPATNLRRFYMHSNSDIKVLRNILNGITFQEMIFSPGPFALEQVSEYFLLSTKETLTSFYIQNSYLDTDSFPFYTLSAFEELTNLDIFRSNLSWIPELQVPNLEFARFHNSFIDYIKPRTFDAVPSLDTVFLENNLITHLEANTFPIREGNARFVLHDNNIASVEPGTFYFDNETGISSSANIKYELQGNKLQSLQAGTILLRDGNMTVYLSYNQIAAIEPATIVMPATTENLRVILHLHFNQLRTFDETVFGEVVPYTTQLYLHDNLFDCGCDVAWLVVNADLMAKVDNATTCRDGTNFNNLDPEAFESTCFSSTITPKRAWTRVAKAVKNMFSAIW